eukprot:2599804-Rhodomonas_salina.1
MVSSGSARAKLRWTWGKRAKTRCQRARKGGRGPARTGRAAAWRGGCRRAGAARWRRAAGCRGASPSAAARPRPTPAGGWSLRPEASDLPHSSCPSCTKVTRSKETCRTAESSCAWFVRDGSASRVQSCGWRVEGGEAEE